ncbi:MAG: SpaA isopeptide-forming pilin-related protein, partial [Romboutsia sp.]
MNKKSVKSISRIMVFIYIFISMLNTTVVGQAYAQNMRKTPKLIQNITISKTSVESGEKVQVKVDYKDMQDIKMGDKIEITIPEVFKDLKQEDIRYSKEHFESPIIEKNKIILTFKQMEGDWIEIGGYITLNIVAKEVKEVTEVKIESKFEEQISNTDIIVKPKPDGGSQETKDVLVTKSCDTGNGGTNITKDENGNLIGRTVDYTIQINEKIVQNISFKLIDDIPEGMELLSQSLELYRIEGKNQIKISSEELENMKSYDENSRTLTINFKNISHIYTLKYKTKITENKDKYNNKARVELEDQNSVGEGTILNSNIEISAQARPGNPEAELGNNGILRKLGTGNNVVVGDEVDYQIFVNEQKKTVHNAKLLDKLPQGTEIIEDSIKIEKEIQTYDSISRPQWRNEDVTKDFKDSDMSNGTLSVSVENNELSVVFPNKIIEKYYVKYKIRITDAHEVYENIAYLAFDVKKGEEYIPETTQVSKTVNFDAGSGSIGVRKSVDKDKITEDDNNIVTYDIYVQSRGGFPESYLNISDQIHKDVIIKSVDLTAINSNGDDISNKVDYKIDGETNTVTVTNLKSLELMDVIKLRITTDFSNVEAGTTVKNLAKVNDGDTNTVVTKKGYKFTGEKIDKETREKLAGAKFKLVDENEKIIIEELVSDENGVIKGLIPKPGKYKIIETYAPEGYELKMTPIRFEIKEYDIGTTVFIGQIENNKQIIDYPDIDSDFDIYPFIGTKIDGDTYETLAGAKFELRDAHKNIIIEDLTSDDDGTIRGAVQNPGTYYLIEKVAPNGYKLDSNIIKVSISDKMQKYTTDIGKIKNYKEIMELPEEPPVIPPVEELPEEPPVIP